MANSNIAYGLAKKYGIDTTGMSPKEVWDALNKKGVDTSGAYSSQSDTAKDLAKTVFSNQKEPIIKKKVENEKPRKELREFARKTYLSTISGEGQKIIEDTLNELSEQYPVDRLREIGTTKEGATADARANGEALYVNPERFNKQTEDNDKGFYDELRKKLETYKQHPDYYNEKFIKDFERRCQFSRWTVSGKDRKAILYHEYGHILADQKFGQINGDMVCSAPYYIMSEKKNYVISVFKKARKTGDIFKLSEYADTNSQEFFAECFCAKMVGQELPDYIEEMFRRVL